MPRFKDQAICLRDVDWSETSQVVVLLTRDHGKVRGLAKGSRRQSPSAIAKFSGGINLLNRGEVVATTRRGGQLAAVTEWDLQNDYYLLRTGLRGQRLAMYAADLCDAMLAEEDAHAGTFGALSSFLESLAPGGAKAPPPSAQDVALLGFQWAVLCDCGYRPELHRDVAAAGPLDALGSARAYTFDPLLGGFTTRDGVGDSPWRVRAGTLTVLRRLATPGNSPGNTPGTGPRNDSASAPRGAVEPLDEHGVVRANRLLCSYARSLLDRELPTMGVVLGR